LDFVVDTIGLLDTVTRLYNEERPHLSIGNLTPNELHHAEVAVEVRRLWKNYYVKKEPSFTVE
jgi:putative transposase